MGANALVGIGSHRRYGAEAVNPDNRDFIMWVLAVAVTLAVVTAAQLLLRAR